MLLSRVIATQPCAATAGIQSRSFAFGVSTMHAGRVRRLIVAPGSPGPGAIGAECANDVGKTKDVRVKIEADVRLHAN